MRTLIVDGYNVVHAWPHLKQAMRERGLADARAMLVHALSEYGASTGVAITVVFDAHGRRDDGAVPEVIDGVTVRFGTRGASADHVIERLANDAARRGRAMDLVVATDDNLQRSLVAAMGVPTMSAKTLLGDVQRASSKLRAQRRSDAQPAASGRLEQQLPDDVLRRLEALRRGDEPDVP